MAQIRSLISTNQNEAREFFENILKFLCVGKKYDEFTQISNLTQYKGDASVLVILKTLKKSKLKN